MSTATKIESPYAPRAIGPYSQAVKTESLIFVSGQLPVDPKTGLMVEGGIMEKTSKVIDNLEAILKEAGSSLDKVVQVNVYLKHFKADYAQMNEVYMKRFTSKVPPARVTVEVSELPLSASVEISCVALAN